jgi:reactive intermediate/imine deaminase
MRRLYPSPQVCGTAVFALFALGFRASVAHAQATGATRKQVINRPDARPGVLSPAVRIGDVVYLSGVLGTKPGGGGLAEGGIVGQARQALENVKSAVALAGGTMQDIVKCTVFLTDVKDFAAMNQVYREFFPTDPPARSTVAVAGLVVPNAVIEIECIAAAR